MTKVCSKCKSEKEISEFPKKKKYKDGIYCWCKECCRKHDRELKKNMDPAKKKEYGRKTKLKQNYGITPEQYNKMLIEQNHKCAICGKDETEVHLNRLYVDHCHASGAVRGLLCHHCNFAIGMLQDSVENAMNAAAYLSRSAE